MKVLVTGATSLPGSAILRELESRTIPCLGVDAPEFDVTKDADVRRQVQEAAPDVIIHCIPYTNMDKAESEPAECAGANGFGALTMARAANEVGAKLVLLSTAQVFPGTAERPNGINDPYGPRNVYGMSMVQAEDAVRSLMTRYYVVRTGPLFGGGKDAVRTALRASQDNRELRLAGDRIANPTYAPDLAKFLCSLINTNYYGIWHARNEGAYSPAEFAKLVIKKAGRTGRIVALPDTEMPPHARRTMDCRLAAELPAGFSPFPSVENALERCLVEVSY